MTLAEVRYGENIAGGSGISCVSRSVLPPGISHCPFGHVCDTCEKTLSNIVRLAILFLFICLLFSMRCELLVIFDPNHPARDSHCSGRFITPVLGRARRSLDGLMESCLRPRCRRAGPPTPTQLDPPSRPRPSSLLGWTPSPTWAITLWPGTPLLPGPGPHLHPSSGPRPPYGQAPLYAGTPLQAGPAKQ